MLFSPDAQPDLVDQVRDSVMAVGLNVKVHPDVSFYLDVQAVAYVVLAILLLTFLLTIAAFPYKRRRPQDIVFVLAGMALVAFGAYVAVASWVLIPRDDIALSETELRVGDERLALGADLDVSLQNTPPDVEYGDQGYFRLPSSGGRALPFFNGGPAMLVKSGGKELRLFPVMYGPSAYFGTNGSQDATKLFTALAARAKSGDGGTWLEAIYRPFEGDARATTPSRTALFVVGGLIGLVLLSFLIGLQVAIRRKRHADASKAAAS